MLKMQSEIMDRFCNLNLRDDLVNGLIKASGNSLNEYDYDKTFSRNNLSLKLASSSVTEHLSNPGLIRSESDHSDLRSYDLFSDSYKTTENVKLRPRSLYSNSDVAFPDIRNLSFFDSDPSLSSSWSTNDDTFQSSLEEDFTSSEISPTFPLSFSPPAYPTFPPTINNMNTWSSRNDNVRPLRSQKVDIRIVYEMMYKALANRISGYKREVCVFCRNNGEHELIYTSHSLKDMNNRVTCPILRAYQCPICSSSGDAAHTIKYCPYNMESNNITPLEKLFRGTAGLFASYKQLQDARLLKQ